MKISEFIEKYKSEKDKGKEAIEILFKSIVKSEYVNTIVKMEVIKHTLATLCLKDGMVEFDPIKIEVGQAISRISLYTLLEFEDYDLYTIYDLLSYDDILYRILAYFPEDADIYDNFFYKTLNSMKEEYYSPIRFFERLSTKLIDGLIDKIGDIDTDSLNSFLSTLNNQNSTQE